MGDCVANLWEEMILLGCPLLDHFDGLFCRRSEIRSSVSRGQEGEGNVRVICRGWVVEARSLKDSSGMDGGRCVVGSPKPLSETHGTFLGCLGACSFRLQ